MADVSDATAISLCNVGLLTLRQTLVYISDEVYVKIFQICVLHRVTCV